MMSFIGVGVLAQKGVQQRMKSRDAVWQTFTVVCERRWGPGPEDQTHDVIDLAAFRQTALADLNNLAVGDLVEVRGAVQSQTFTRKDGNASVYVRLHVDSIYLLVKNFAAASTNSMASAPDQPKKSQERAPTPAPAPDSDLPF